MKESLKPIEPGCLALTIAGNAAGIIVMVVRSGLLLYPKPSRCIVCQRSDRWWVLETETHEGDGCECSLMRIDPDEDVLRQFRGERADDLREEKLDELYRQAAERLREMDR